MVADVAKAKQHAYDKRVEKKQATCSNQSPTSDLLCQARCRSPRCQDNEAKLTIDGTSSVSEHKKVKMKVDGKCFLYQKEGHMACYCLQTRAIIAVLADLDKESSDNNRNFSSSTSLGQWEN
jgi:hypothetical protein